MREHRCKALDVPFFLDGVDLRDCRPIFTKTALTIRLRRRPPPPVTVYGLSGQQPKRLAQIFHFLGSEVREPHWNSVKWGWNPLTPSSSIHAVHRWMEPHPRYVVPHWSVKPLTVGIRHPPLRSPGIAMADFWLWFAWVLAWSRVSDGADFVVGLFDEWRLKGGRFRVALELGSAVVAERTGNGGLAPQGGCKLVVAGTRCSGQGPVGAGMVGHREGSRHNRHACRFWALLGHAKK
ncbi:hypothetical protein GQ457_15G017540 [Hibiscus cannabinus]